jgi:hypothetical protein
VTVRNGQYEIARPAAIEAARDGRGVVMLNQLA